MQSAAQAKSAESYNAEFRHIENTSINVTLLNLLYGLIYTLNKRVANRNSPEPHGETTTVGNKPQHHPDTELTTASSDPIV